MMKKKIDVIFNEIRKGNLGVLGIVVIMDVIGFALVGFTVYSVWNIGWVMLFTGVFLIGIWFGGCLIMVDMLSDMFKK